MTNDFQVLGVDEENQTFMGKVFNGDMPIMKQIYRAKQIKGTDRVRSEVRGFYRVLIAHPVETKQLEKFPSLYRHYFRYGQNQKVQTEIVHSIARIEAGYVIPGTYFPKSTDDDSATNADISGLIEKTMDLFLSWKIDTESFVTEWARRREAAGKEA
jgi:hypothetical protein